MSDATKTAKLLQLLERDETLRNKEYEFVLESDCVLLVERWGHSRGLWHYANKVFYWTPAGYNEPVHCALDEVEALAYSIAILTAI